MTDPAPGAAEEARHLTLAEQRAFHAALRRSVTILPERPKGWRCPRGITTCYCGSAYCSALNRRASAEGGGDGG